MDEQWVNERLCCFAGDTVRIEMGPQIVKLPATPENLSNEVTAPHYQLGRRDALGKVIEAGADMDVVDWRARKVPHIWKIYKKELVTEVDKDGNEVQVERFIKKDEVAGKDDAIAAARTLAGGVN